MVETQLEIGNKAARDVSFEPEFYLRAYPDVQEASVDPAAHYFAFGLEERRYGSSVQLEADIEAVRASGLFRFDPSNQQNKGYVDPIREYLVRGWRVLPPSEDFDRDFVQAYYPTTLALGENPFAFYCRNWEREWCYPSFSAAQTRSAVIASSPLFSPTYFLREEGVAVVADAATYYCTEGYRLLADPSPNFSTSAYLLEYPDIAAAEINPLHHYIQHGLSEGRLKFPVDNGSGHLGSQTFNQTKPTLLICSHEASRTGAPIVGLNLARHLSSRFNVISMVLRGGALIKEFGKVSTELVVSGDTAGQIQISLNALIRRHRFDAVILNSVECTKLLPALVQLGIPSVSLLHEFAQYVWPFNLLARAITLSDAVVFPSTLVEREGLKEAQRLGLGPIRPTNLHIRPQGRCMVPLVSADRGTRVRLPTSLQTLSAAKDRPLIVLAAGQVQPRKGVDLFIEAARILKHDLGVHCHFVWVGGGYAPKTDLSLSVYLADQVDRSDLADVVTFVPEQASLQPFWDLADAFFMSSRLDPFPNVALDAIAEGVPLVCFEKATGIADLAIRWPERVHAARYNDARDAAQVFAGLAKKRHRGEKLRFAPVAEVDRFLSFSHYAADIAELVDLAVSRRDNRKHLSQLLRASPHFVPELLDRTLPGWLRLDGLNAWSRGSRLADLAALSASNGVPVGYLWDGKVCALPDHAVSSAPTWGDADFQVAEAGLEGATGIAYCAVAFVDEKSTLDILTDALFQLINIKHVAIVSASLEEEDIQTLRATAGSNRVSLHQTRPNQLEETLANVVACIGEVGPIHLIKGRAIEPNGAGQESRLSLNVSVVQSALSMLETNLELKVVVQQPDWSAPSFQAHTNPHSPTSETGSLLPDRLVDQTQAWCNLEPGGWTDELLRDLLLRFTAGSLDGVWDSLAERVRAMHPTQRGLVASQPVGSGPVSEVQERRNTKAGGRISVHR